MTTLHIDFETRSTVDLKKAGVYVYAEHPDTDVWCAAYAFDDGPINLWTLGSPCPDDIYDHVVDGGVIAAWNASFERIIWWAVLAKRHGWPKPKREQFRCVMVQAMAMGLPASLEMGAAALGITQQKDMTGSRLALQMAKPRKIVDGKPVWWDGEDRFAKLYAYCKQDVEVERAADARLVPLKDSERQLWLLDQTINDRGVAVDVKLCTQAQKIVEAEVERLDKELKAVTKGEVTGVSNHAQLATWIRSRGIETEGVAKDDVAGLLGRDLPEDVRAALEIRQEGAKTSLAKIPALLKCINTDGRARGLLQFHGAGTGRWAGRRFQPQNLTRPVHEHPEEFIPAIMTGRADILGMVAESPLQAISDCIRNMLCAAPGKRLKSADFANIEGRVNAWLAGETWKLKAFRDFDAGVGPDLYKVAAGGIFGIDIKDVSKKQRQIGKVSELSLGYEGGVGAFVTMAPNYGMKIADYYDEVTAGVPSEFVAEAREKFAKDAKKLDAQWGERTYAPAESIKLAWRHKHPGIVKFWSEAKWAAIGAVESPGKVTRCAGGRVKYRVAGSFLWCQLPSGRALCYPYPKLVEVTTPWGKKQPALRAKGVNSFTRKWEEYGLYGGLLVENIVQAVARDLMAEAMVRVDGTDPIVLTVHDELLSESANDGTIEEYQRVMAELPTWAVGCPVAAEGWVGERYRK